MLYFIINEENEYKNNIIRKEISPEVKSEYPKKFIPTFEIKAERETNDEQYFLMWNANSCRYDVFFYIYIISKNINFIRKISYLNKWKKLGICY